MTATTAADHPHRPLLPIANLALATAALTVSLIAITTDSPASEGAVAPETQTRASAQQADNVHLADIASVSPTKRPATGDNDQARWRHDVQLMPSGWPATEVMRRAILPQTVEHAAADSNPINTSARWSATQEQLRLRETVAKMPSGWPASEVMGRAAEQPLGDAAERERWRHETELMPAGWPATEAMRRATSESSR